MSLEDMSVMSLPLRSRVNKTLEMAVAWWTSCPWSRGGEMATSMALCPLPRKLQARPSAAAHTERDGPPPRGVWDAPRFPITRKPWLRAARAVTHGRFVTYFFQFGVFLNDTVLVVA